jgi:hypothetical protein
VSPEYGVTVSLVLEESSRLDWRNLGLFGGGFGERRCGIEQADQASRENVGQFTNSLVATQFIGIDRFRHGSVHRNAHNEFRFAVASLSDTGKERCLLLTYPVNLKADG